MNASNLQPIGKLSEKRGAKVLLWGPPGTGKTPMALALPGALGCICEAGLMSARDNMTTPGYYCPNFETIDEFFKWFCNPNSKDVRMFKTLVIDSITALADIVLEYEERRNKDIRQAYQKMAKYVMWIVNYLQNMPNMNVVLIAQMGVKEITVPGIIPGTKESQTKYYPLFPGNVLIDKVPHTMDEVWYVHNCRRPDNTFGPAIATVDMGNAHARSRSRRLEPLEPPNLLQLFNKINQ